MSDKTPEEIKKGLETCAIGYELCTGNCTYEESHGSAPKCMIALQQDTLAYIQQLETKVSELEKRCDAEQLNATYAITERAEVVRRFLRYIEIIMNTFPKWNSVDVMLPEEVKRDDEEVSSSDLVIVAVRDDMNNIFVSDDILCKGEWVNYSAPLFEVTHWMSLPELPKEDVHGAEF